MGVCESTAILAMLVSVVLSAVFVTTRNTGMTRLGYILIGCAALCGILLASGTVQAICDSLP